MLLFKKVEDLQEYLTTQRAKGYSIGFVPTMGALHQGHLSLIEQAKNTTSLCVCSIFVNPTQFNDLKDLEKYPRTTSQDILLLNGVNTDVLFLPEVEGVYPPGHDTSLNLDFGQLDQVLEGEFRPGHFTGMAQVVNRLLEIVQPNALFMGQKDFQQLTIVRNMLEQLGLDTQLVMCAIIRESDGLAMSSRNRRLTPHFRETAPIIHQTLQAVKGQIKEQTPKELESWAIRQLEEAGLRPEYFRIVDGRTLENIDHFKDSNFVVACLAAWAGEIRLIDNLILRHP